MPMHVGVQPPKPIRIGDTMLLEAEKSNQL